MPWCPKCKVEYKDGITVCADCGSILAESEEAAKQQELEKLKELQAKLQEEMMEYAEETDEEDAEEYEVLQNPIAYKSGVYQKSEDKAKEFKSSAYVLVFVGILGIALLVMIHLGIIKIEFANQLLMDCVMGGMFLAFIIIGIFSFRSSKQYEKKSLEENSLSDNIQKWCDENLNEDVIDSAFSEEETLSEEMKYFRRTARMKELISEKYMNLDEDFLDHIVEQYYEKIFEG